MGVKAKRYRAEFIEPGLVSYRDMNAGMVFVSREAIDQMLPSFVGCPVFNLSHKETETEDAFDFDKMFSMTKEEKAALADGIISATGWNLETGWAWADMLIFDEETQKNLDKRDKDGRPVFSVSCAYIPTDTGPNGVRNNIKFDEEVLTGMFTHMAVVDTPRYEGAKVYENSKGGEKVKTFKLFTKKPKLNSAVPPPKEKPEEGEEMKNAEEAYVVVGDEKIALSDLIDAYKSTEEKEEPTEDGNLLNSEDEVDMGEGKKVKVAELVAAYSKKNEALEPTDPKDVEPVVKTNSIKERPNANFKTLKNAAERIAEQKPTFQSRSERIAEGNARYSLKEVK